LRETLWKKLLVISEAFVYKHQPRNHFLIFEKGEKMKLKELLLAAALLIVPVTFLFLSVQTTFAQDPKIALQRGYRTGYSDGYMAGYRDVIENSTRDYIRHPEYQKADRAYNRDFGTIEDFRDGYRQGFANGYGSGFEKRAFDSTLPENLGRTGISAISETTAGGTTGTATTSTGNTEPPVLTTETQTQGSLPTGDAIVIIPAETEIVVELIQEISTDKNRVGDKFLARVVSPMEIVGSIIEGRITKIQLPGKISRRAELSLSFDIIRLSDNRWSNYSAILTEVLPLKGDGVKRVDDEGTVQSKTTNKRDAITVGSTTGTGLVLGAVVGGPVGAAVGAGVGAAFGVGAVVVERGRHIKLANRQQLRIKTSYETQIR
jgi:hypothetical protein